MHIFRPWPKHLWSLKEIGIKLWEELRIQGTHYLFTLIVKMSKKRLSSTCRKSDEKKNLRTISKPHAYLQTMTQSPVKFPKNRHKTVGGVANTRYSLSIDFDSENDEKMAKFNLWKKWQKIIWGLYPNHMHIFRPWKKTSVKFQKNQHKTVGGVAHTRYPLSIHFDCKNAWKMAKLNLWKKWQKKILGLYPNHMHIFRPWTKHLLSFERIGIKL